MAGISRFLHNGWTPVQCVVEWRRKISSRNGSDDARRARAARLLMQQAGPPIGSYPCGLEQEALMRGLGRFIP